MGCFWRAHWLSTKGSWEPVFCSRVYTQDCLKPKQREWVSHSHTTALMSEFQRQSRNRTQTWTLDHQRSPCSPFQGKPGDSQLWNVRRVNFQGCRLLVDSPESTPVKPFLFLHMAYLKKGLFGYCSIFCFMCLRRQDMFCPPSSLKKYLSWHLPIFLSTWKLLIF